MWSVGSAHDARIMPHIHRRRGATARNPRGRGAQPYSVGREQRRSVARRAPWRVAIRRVGRNILLNQAGEAFLVEARGVLAKVAAAEAALDDLSGLASGRLSIHASQTIASYWLPPRFAEFHRAHPVISLDVDIGNTAQVAKAVIEDAAELGPVEGEIDDPILNRTLIGQDPIALIVSREHPWATGKPPKAFVLTVTAWVIREDGSGTQSTF